MKNRRTGNAGAYTAMAGCGMAVLSLPFLLSRKHPFLIAGWVVLAMSCLLLNPCISVAPWGLWGGMRRLFFYFTRLHYGTYLFAALVGIVQGTLFLILLFLTGRAIVRRRRAREGAE